MTNARTFYGAAKIPFLDGIYKTDVFFYDTLETIQKNIPMENWIDGIPPGSLMNHSAFLSMKGSVVASPGDTVVLDDGNRIHLYKHVIMVDRVFSSSLSIDLFDAIVILEEVVYDYITVTGQESALTNPADYVITHDLHTCKRGVSPKNIRQAISQSLEFEMWLTTKLFKMDSVDKLLLKVMYAFKKYSRHCRIRRRNLFKLEKNPPISLVNKRVDIINRRKYA